MLTLIKYPNALLREKMPDFDFDNPIMDPKQLEKEMLEFMYRYGGIGLAANQVGIKTRVFVMGHESRPESSMAFFNPMIIASTEKIEDLEEGCLSFPGIFVKIKRPSAIRVKYQTSSGVWEEAEFKDYDCKCFLHEYDHLEGIVFKDRISELKWALAAKKSQKRKVNVATR